MLKSINSAETELSPFLHSKYEFLNTRKKQIDKNLEVEFSNLFLKGCYKSKLLFTMVYLDKYVLPNDV